MMKQVAFAALAAMASAYKPQLVLSYRDTQNYFLGLEHDNPAMLKMPRDHRARDSEVCEGWKLSEGQADPISFDLDILSPPEGVEGCTKLVFRAKDADVYARELVEFTNTCAEEGEEATLKVYDQVYDDI